MLIGNAQGEVIYCDILSKQLSKTPIMNLREFFITNSWWGKVLGAFFGYLMAGAIGALIGILVGNFFDRAFSEYYSNPHWLYYSEKTQAVQQIFFKATFSIMGYIAKIDGRVSEQEIHIAKVLMGEMRLNNDQKKQARFLFNKGKSGDIIIPELLSELKNLCGQNSELLKLFIDIQYQAAQVDGLSIKKIAALDSVITQLGFVPLSRQNRFYEDFTEPFSRQQETRTPPKTQLDHAYAILEVSPQATKQEVKRAYRLLMSRNHPDKLIAQGLPQEMIKMANDKTQKISKAYSVICENRGW